MVRSEVFRSEVFRSPFEFDEREEKAGGRAREYGWRMKNSSGWKMRATSHKLPGNTSEHFTFTVPSTRNSK